MGRKKKEDSPSESTTPKPLIPTEMKGIFLLLGTFLTLVSLLSFHHGEEQANWLGLAGYGISWLLFSLFGLGSYLWLTFASWLGWRWAWNLSVNRLKAKFAYTTMGVVGACMLLNVAAENSDFLSEGFDDRVITTHTHTYLGGVPLYFIYADLPIVSLRRLLSDPGITLIFGMLFSSALMLLGKIRLSHAAEAAKKFKETRKQAKEEREEGPSTRLALPFYGFQGGTGSPAIGSSDEEEEDENSSFIAAPTSPLPQQEPLEEEVVELHPLPRILPSIKIRPIASEQKPPCSSTREKREQAIQAQKLWNGDFSRFNKPTAKLLSKAKPVDQSAVHKGLKRQAEILEETLLSFGIEAKVGHIHCGPSITAFEVLPAVGVKVQRIIALENDIALNLKAKSIRIIAPIPGKAAVGIEVPNPHPQEVSFREMLEAYKKEGKHFHIPVLLGKTVTGEYVMSDLAKMPHCIIAGATGSGKSVCINTIVMSILMNAKPDEVRLMMVDPKKVELTPYSRLPHMIAPVITEPQGACAALNWLVKEMEKRYEILKQVGVRNIAAFNERTPDTAAEGELEIDVPPKMGFIVCIIDELADLMMVSSADIETPIARIAQMARAVGIHLILATQRPSREVITGLIKANFPTRISFKVSSRINSQIVLDEVGGETLLGNGDMLYLPPGTSTLIRAQGAFIRDEDINQVIEHICKQAPPQYLIESFDADEASDFLTLDDAEETPRDTLYDQALETVMLSGSASTTFLQRKLKIGYARAASIMDQLEEAGVVGPAEGSKPRKVILGQGAESS